jgi:hypothetical protein
VFIYLFKIKNIDHLHSYQLLPIFASISSAIKRSLLNGCSISCRTSSKASFADYSGPSRINSSWICISNFHPSYFSRSFLAIFIIEAITISAAPPWIGVFIARRIHIPFIFFGALSLKNLSKRLNLPSKVWVNFFCWAVFCFYICHLFTYGRSLNQHSITFSASSKVQFQSAANPRAVFPYAIEKLTVFAFFLYAAYFSFKSGTGGAPFDLSHYSKTLPV